MKKTYEKPQAEFIDFSIEEHIMADLGLDGGIDGDMGVSGLPEGWE